MSNDDAPADLAEMLEWVPEIATRCGLPRSNVRMKLYQGWRPTDKDIGQCACGGWIIASGWCVCGHGPSTALSVPWPGGPLYSARG